MSEETKEYTIYDVIGACFLVAVIMLSFSFSYLHWLLSLEKRIPRNETLIRTEKCEIWQICDYRCKNLYDVSSSQISQNTGNFYKQECEEVYECWEERRNCERIEMEETDLLLPEEKVLVPNECSCFNPTRTECSSGYDILERGKERLGSMCGCCGDYQFCKYESICHKW